MQKRSKTRHNARVGGATTTNGTGYNKKKLTTRQQQAVAFLAGWHERAGAHSVMMTSSSSPTTNLRVPLFVARIIVEFLLGGEHGGQLVQESPYLRTLHSGFLQRLMVPAETEWEGE
ncbi:hypothetical protein Pelo_7785 [Pelomyxa schiedti]|nr:hypothetical protein Pelo_7785 [Pelomyxa schiedti]